MSEPSLVKHPGPTLLLQASKRLLPEVKWRIPPLSVCAGPGLQGELAVHAVPVSSENRNVGKMGMTYWLGSAAGKPVTDHSGQIEPLHYVLKQGANAQRIT